MQATQSFTKHSACPQFWPVPLNHHEVREMHEAARMRPPAFVRGALSGLGDIPRSPEIEAICTDIVACKKALAQDITAKELRKMVRQGISYLEQQRTHLLKESLSDPFNNIQRAVVNKSMRLRYRPHFVKTLFGKQDRIYFKLPEITSRTHKDIEAWLGDIQPGLSLKDYQAGLALDARGNTLKIGRLLTKNGALTLRKAFEEDHTRNSGRLRVALTRNGEDLARVGTNRRYGITCLSARHSDPFYFLDHIPATIRGCIAAYLIREDDPYIQDPLARVLLKPYLDSEGEIICYRPDQVYGLADESFRVLVNDIATRHLGKSNTAAICRIAPGLEKEQMKARIAYVAPDCDDSVLWQTAQSPDSDLRQAVSECPEDVPGQGPGYREEGPAFSQLASG